MLATFRPSRDTRKQSKGYLERPQKAAAVNKSKQVTDSSVIAVTSPADTTAATAAAAAAAAMENSTRVKPAKSLAPTVPTPSQTQQGRKKEPIYARIRKAKEDAKILKNQLEKLQLELDAEEEELTLLEKAEARGW